MIKKQRSILFLSSLFLLCAPVHGNDPCNSCTSHQFVPRSISTDLVYTNMLNFYERHHRNEKQKIIYAGTFFYQQSNKSSAVGSAFLRGSSNCINVAQDGSGDVSSFWLGLANTNPANPFASTFCIQPERKALGYFAYFFFDLSDWLCGLWIDGSSAIVNARHNLNCCEQGNTASACAGISSVSQALNNPLYQFGKFNCSNCSINRYQTGIDDIQLRAGYEHNWCNDTMIGGMYIMGTIPTGDAVNAEYIFQPVVGSRHGSIGIGFEGEYKLSLCGKDVTLLFDANYRYAFKHAERRTFDLCANGQLSRFLLVANQSDPSSAMPAVNYLTQDVDVKPRSTFQGWLAVHYNRCNYDFEFGYNLFWRQSEKILFYAFCDDRTVGIYQLGCAGNNCTTASTATIAQGPNQITADATFVAITARDLNLSSAAAGKALSNKFYAAIERKRCANNCLDWFAGIGASYEFVTGSYKCTTLPFWALFAKFGLIF